MRKLDSVFWGIIIIAVGVILGGNAFNVWNIDVFFNGWWTLFIIVPSIYGLFRKEWFGSIMGLALGVLLLLASQGFIDWDMIWKAMLPILLILIGLTLIFKPKFNTKKINKENNGEYIGVFSNNVAKITEKFTGAEVITVFGGADIDLRNADIKEDIVIDCVTVFGGIDIKPPKNVRIKTSGVPIFGGVSDKAEHGDGPTIIVNYVAIFGGIDIK